MQAHQFLEIAAFVAGQCPVLVRVAPRISETALEQYWISSKCRLDRWGRELKNYAERLAAAGAARSQLWQQAQPLLEEILATEVLTRVWTAVGCGLDEQQKTRDVGPIVRGVYVGHLEARNRVLGLMLHGQGFGVEAAVLLNRLRHRIERWTDMLLGYVQTAVDAREFAFDPLRVSEFADDILHERCQPGGQMAWNIALASLRATFLRSLHGVASNPDLNERIAASILSSFDPSLFDAHGLCKSLWLVRMSNTAKDTQGMIDTLLAEEKPTPAVRRAPHVRRPGVGGERLEGRG